MVIAALTSANIITRTLDYVSETSATAAENTTRRAKLLQDLQELVIDLWLLREWPWSMRSATLAAVSSDGVSTLPADFYEVGRTGSVQDTATKRRLISVDLQDMYILHESFASGCKDYSYAIGHGVDDAATRTILFPKGWSGVSTLKIYYRRIPPSCVDGTGDELVEIPIAHGWNVLLPGLRWRALEQVNDPRYEKWYADYRTALNTMVRDERSGPQRDTSVAVARFGRW